MRADKLMRRLILGKLTNYSVVRTSPEPLHTLLATALSKWLTINRDVKTIKIKENLRVHTFFFSFLFSYRAIRLLIFLSPNYLIKLLYFR
jgi:hypothetical protein